MENKTRILIIDDESITLDFFDVMLSKLGFEVIRAEDGEEALEKVKETVPDIIMTDNILPKITGWQFTRILKNSEEYAEFRDIPVIMLSAVSDVKDKIEGYDLGVEDYILKPFNFLEVLARIRAVLRQRELQKQIVAKEAKLSGLKSLNESLVYFTRHLKEPIAAVKEAVEGADAANPDSVAQLVDSVRKEVVSLEAALAALDEKIRESDSAEGENGANMLSELEERFQKHIQTLSRKELE